MIKSRWTMLPGTLLALVSLLWYGWSALTLFWHYPPVWPDEALLASPAISLLQHGTMGTSLWTGLLPGVEARTYWMPPLYFLLMAGSFFLWGPSLIVMRSFSVVCGLGVIAISYAMGRRSRLPVWSAGLIVVLLATDSLFLRASLIGRMDLLALAFILLTLWSLTKESPQPSQGRSLITGGIAALAPLTHPMGIVVLPVALAGQLLHPGRARLHRVVLLLTGMFLTLLPWGLYIAKDVPSFKTQWGGQMAMKLDRPIVKPFSVKAYEQLKNSGATRQAMPLWGLGLAGLCVAGIKRRSGWLLLLTQLGLFALVFRSQEMWYLVYLAPLTALGITHLLALIRPKPIWRLLPALLLITPVAPFIRQNVDRIRHEKELAQSPAYDFHSWSQAVSAHIPPGSRVLVASSPDPTFTLLTRPDLTLRHFVPDGIPVDPDAYQRVLSRSDFIIVSSQVPSKQAVQNFALKHGEIVATIGTSLLSGYRADIFRINHEEDK